MTSKPDAPLWNIENIRQGKKPAWNYIDGCMIMSLLELYKVTKNQKYFEFAEKYIDHRIEEDGTIIGYNNVNVGGTEESWPLIEFTVEGKQYQDDYPMFEGAELGKEITVYASPVRATYRCTLYKTSFKHIYIPAFLLSGICFLLRRKKRVTVTE